MHKGGETRNGESTCPLLHEQASFLQLSFFFFLNYLEYLRSGGVCKKARYGIMIILGAVG